MDPLRPMPTMQSEQTVAVAPGPTPRFELMSAAAAGRLLWAVAAAGIVCRVVQYLWDRSFWVDEASLVLNIRGKTASQLLGPLDFHQAAPPLFLLAERGLYHLLGGSEWSLRILPLALGCVAVALFAVLARRLLSPLNAVLALAIFAFSDRLIWHSVEVKQYGTDVFFALLLLVAAIPSAQADPRPLRRLLLLSVLSAACLWCSYPVIFVFGGLSLALLPACVRRGAKSAAAYVLGNLLVAGSFLVLLGTVVRAQQTESLEQYWAEHFVDLHHPLTWPAWLGGHVLSLFNYPAQPAGIVLLLLALVGVIGLVRSRRVQLLAMLANPIGLNLLAAAAHRYPFDGKRLIAYLLPMAILLADLGAETLLAQARPRLKPWALAPAAAVAMLAAGVAGYHLFVPQYRSHLRPAVRFVRSHLNAGDGIYVLSQREFECYWPSTSAEASSVRFRLDASDRIPFHRFWVVAAYPNDDGRRRLKRVRAWARTFATQKLSFADRGGVAWLFELPDAPRPHLPPPDVSTHHKMMSAQMSGE